MWLYRLAVEAGDQRTALSILDSLARLQGLTPEGELAEAVRQATEERAKVLGGRFDGDGGGTPRVGGPDGDRLSPKPP